MQTTEPCLDPYAGRSYVVFLRQGGDAMVVSQTGFGRNNSAAARRGNDQMKTDYDEAAKTYDNTRNSNDLVLDVFEEKVPFTKTMNILDFGCGTGNYLSELSSRHATNFFGLEPSDGMREKAQTKNSGLLIKKGDHSDIPFKDDYFDFVYMTDVIHHVSNLKELFKNLHRKVKPNGILCIATQSHAQIETRWYNRYFPSLVRNEQERYPDIDRIIEVAQKNGFHVKEIEIINCGNRNRVTKDFVRMVQEKNYSMFRTLEEVGLKALERDIGTEVTGKAHGETLLWLAR